MWRGVAWRGITLSLFSIMRPGAFNENDPLFVINLINDPVLEGQPVRITPGQITQQFLPFIRIFGKNLNQNIFQFLSDRWR